MTLQGFVWVDASAKMPTWQRRRSLRACLPDQAGGASEEAPPARRGGRGARATWHSSRCNSYRNSRCNSVHKCPKTAPRGHFDRSVYTPASPRLSTTAQQCTQMSQSGAERLDPPICVHYCDPKATHNPSPRRNSVHKCPETAPRGHFRRFVYTPASVALAVRPTSPGW